MTPAATTRRTTTPAGGPPPSPDRFTLEAGDSAVFPPNVAGEIRNDGPDRVVVLVSIVEPLGGGEATPVAGTPAA